MSTVMQAPATLDDLAKVEGKAELIDGKIVPLIAASLIHNRVAANIFVALRTHARRTGVGQAFTDNMGFALRPKLPSGRESFSPDAAYHAGPFPADEWSFVMGGPTFAVEVRSSDDFGPAAEKQMAEKRADYFAAGTAVVWDVDPDAEVVAMYHSAPRRMCPRHSDAETWPTRNQPFPTGKCRWTTFLPDVRPALTLRRTWRTVSSMMIFRRLPIAIPAAQGVRRQPTEWLTGS